MRTLIDINERQLRRLDELAKRQRQSRAAVIREAIDGYLEEKSSKAASDAFGLWGKREVDGLAYQKKVRSEW
jgi:metal-responsive CopG/Arc/MetJ family transcriptional regulator